MTTSIDNKLSEYELSEIADPQWDAHARLRLKAVQEWRAYIPDDIQKNWGKLSFESRVCAYLVANEAADNEDWD